MEVLRISSDRDDRRIFWGLKVSNSGFFLGRRILASIFLGVVSFNAFWNFFLVEGGGGGFKCWSRSFIPWSGGGVF